MLACRRWNFLPGWNLLAWNPPQPWPYKGASMGILISILITFLVIVLVLYLINMLPIDGRAKQIVRVIVIIIGVLSLLKYLAIY
jgi:uncharacterized protein YhhL (DUF1145 family)